MTDFSRSLREALEALTKAAEIARGVWIGSPATRFIWKE